MGTDGPWVPLLSWDLPGSCQTLKLSLSKILEDPKSIPLLGTGGIMLGAAGYLCDLEPLSIPVPILHPGPIPVPSWSHPASSPCKDVEHDPNPGSRRVLPHKHHLLSGATNAFHLGSSSWLRALQPRRVPFLPSPLRQRVAAGGSEGAGGRFCRRPRGPEGCRAGGWAEAQQLMPRCISLCFSGGG